MTTQPTRLEVRANMKLTPEQIYSALQGYESARTSPENVEDVLRAIGRLSAAPAQSAQPVANVFPVVGTGATDLQGNLGVTLVAQPSPTAVVLDERATIRELQKALFYWMPRIAGEDSPAGRKAAEHAYLLVGLDDNSTECWGDQILHYVGTLNREQERLGLVLKDAGCTEDDDYLEFIESLLVRVASLKPVEPVGWALKARDGSLDFSDAQDQPSNEDMKHAKAIGSEFVPLYIIAQPVEQTADISQAKQIEQYVLSVLPSVYYMDPPDGGDVSVLEQLRRMADDAAKYRAAQPVEQTRALTADDADMVWPDDDGETFFHTIDDAVENEVNNAWPIDVDPPANGELELKLKLAKRIPTATIRIFNITENGHEWEILTAARPASGETE
jgi:hypothetical protein